MRVLVPEAGNLQLLAFYVALGAGYFADAGLDVTPVSPPSPSLAQGYFTNGTAPAALLPAPVYERLIEERFPFVLVANLLANDPIDLVVPRALAEARGLTSPRPLVDRLRAMSGLRIGVGPHPRPRLVALFKSQGLDVEALVRVVIVPGRDQDAALAAGEVDALYTHTPFLENKRFVAAEPPRPPFSSRRKVLGLLLLVVLLVATGALGEGPFSSRKRHRDTSV